MGTPLAQNLELLVYTARMRLRGKQRYPFVLMLEPTERCNVSCDGCGRIREYKDLMHVNMSLQQCLGAVEESGAPVVSLCGGEPTVYPWISELVQGILDRRRWIYLCTNAQTLTRTLHKYPRSKRLIFNIHLDGMAKIHDAIMNLPGAFDRAIDALKTARARGYRVCTNTTVFKESDPEEIIELCRYVTSLGAEALLLSPGFSYTALQGADLFLGREQTRQVFRRIWEGVKDLPLGNTPVYWDFLIGKKELSCSAWANPTFNPAGWKGPCYLITDQHHKTFEGLMEDTPWELYGTGKDPRCAQCMVHCGYEGAAIIESGKSIRDMWRMFRWSFL